MLSWAIAFLFVARRRRVLGFASRRHRSSLAKVAFFVFLVLSVVSLVLGRRHF